MDTTRLLIEKGVEINTKSDDGMTPLIRAVHYGKSQSRTKNVFETKKTTLQFDSLPKQATSKLPDFSSIKGQM